MTVEARRTFRKALGSRVLRITLALNAVVVGVSARPVPAVAQSATDSATAQALFDRAKQLMKSGKYLEACPALEESQRIEPRSGTLLNLADCYEHAGRLTSAWSTFLEAARVAKATGSPEREQGARDRAAALVPRLSNLVITAPAATATPGLEITRDGERVGSAQLGLPLPADAGTHAITAKAPGRKPWQTQVTVQGSATTANVTIPDLEPSDATPAGSAGAVASGAPNAPASTSQSEPASGSGAARAESSAAPSHSHAGVIAGAAVTGVFVVGTVITGVLYSGKNHDYNSANDQLAANRSDLHSQVKTLGVVNLALLGGTVVAAGVTVYLWTRPHSEQIARSGGLELHGGVSPGLASFSIGGSL